MCFILLAAEEVTDPAFPDGLHCRGSAVDVCLQPMTDVLNSFDIDQLNDSSLDDFCG